MVPSARRMGERAAEGEAQWAACKDSYSVLHGLSSREPGLVPGQGSGMVSAVLKRVVWQPCLEWM